MWNKRGPGLIPARWEVCGDHACREYALLALLEHNIRKSVSCFLEKEPLNSYLSQHIPTFCISGLTCRIVENFVPCMCNLDLDLVSAAHSMLI